jgi:hypothetical protein
MHGFPLAYEMVAIDNPPKPVVTTAASNGHGHVGDLQ